MRPSLRFAFASVVLLVAPAAALPVREETITLVHDMAGHRLQLRSLARAAVMLVVGPQSRPPIPIQGIQLEVVPDVVVPLGVLKAGDTLSLPVPPEVQGLGAQAVALDLETLVLAASKAVFFTQGQGLDLVESSFRAQLLVSSGIPPEYRLIATLSAPSSGYEARLDSVDKGLSATSVYLRVIAPGPGEIVLPVVTRHTVDVELGTGIAEEVHVYLARETRGVPGPEVYKRMLVLKVPRSQ